MDQSVEIVSKLWPYAVILFSIMFVLLPAAFLIKRVQWHFAKEAKLQNDEQQTSGKPWLSSRIAYGVTSNVIAVASGITATFFALSHTTVATLLMIVSAVPLIAHQVFTLALIKSIREELGQSDDTPKNLRKFRSLVPMSISAVKSAIPHREPLPIA
jgi:hypothetical protein